ncbi:LemA family protein [Parafilimonas sp.]|jgi:LemA protein|uniref:LemA family protein n=1 Tax=Parafilimonas sp. TaxID=1969739 RepID=UPI003F7EC9BB
MKTKNLALIVILGLIVLIGGCVGCGSIAFQKKGVALDENVKAKFANVQSEYQRRSDLIPNLVSTVKGEANFEQTTLENVIKARASATQVKVDPNDLTPEKLQEFQQAQGQLSQALGRLLVVTENYPNLRANDAFRGLQVQLEGTENRIKVARNDFNTAVQEYNTTIRTFPNNFYAGWFGFTPKQPFQADAGAEKAPSVDFDKK